MINMLNCLMVFVGGLLGVLSKNWAYTSARGIMRIHEVHA